jgi:hypothetical protein
MGTVWSFLVRKTPLQNQKILHFFLFYKVISAHLDPVLDTADKNQNPDPRIVQKSFDYLWLMKTSKESFAEGSRSL